MRITHPRLRRPWRLALVAVAAALAAAVVPVPLAARQESSPQFVRYDITSPLAIPDAGTVDSLVFVDGVEPTSPILDVRVSLHILHPRAADLDVSLVGPDGTIVELTSDNGGTGANYGSDCTSGRTVFDDAAATVIADGTAPFVGTFRPEQPLAAFAGKVGSGAANGIWRLRLADDTAGETGSLRCWSLSIDAAITAPTAVDDAYATPINVPLVVAAPGVLANDSTNGGGAMTAAALTQPTHGFLTFSSDGGFTYTPSTNFIGVDSFAYRAYNGVGSIGSNAAWVHITVAPPPPMAEDDAYATPFETTLIVPAPGVLANDLNPVPTSSMTAGLVTLPAHGTLALAENGGFTYTPAAGYYGTDSFTYRAINLGGAGNIATVTLTVGPPTTAQPPSGLHAWSVTGNLVTLRWTPPVVGAPPTQYVVEGGLVEGQVLASLPTGSAYPVYTFVAPTGSFYVRVHTVAGPDKSAASNEIRLHVNVPVAPSAPADLVALVNGSTLHMAWRNTYGGGAPARLAVSVAGDYTGAFPLGVTDTFAFAGVPGGTYTLRVSAINAGGVSAPSNPVTVTFPGACSGAPLPPTGFLAYAVGRTLFVMWNPPAAGFAPTSYVVDVSGAYTGQVAAGTRALSSPVAPGVYHLRVAAVNACGTSAFTSVQSVAVP